MQGANTTTQGNSDTTSFFGNQRAAQQAALTICGSLGYPTTQQHPPQALFCFRVLSVRGWAEAFTPQQHSLSPACCMPHNQGYLKGRCNNAAVLTTQSRLAAVQPGSAPPLPAGGPQGSTCPLQSACLRMTPLWQGQGRRACQADGKTVLP